MQEDDLRSLVLQSRLLTNEQIAQLLLDLASKKQTSELLRKFTWRFTDSAPGSTVPSFWGIQARLKLALSIPELVDLQTDLRYLIDPLKNPRQVCHIGHRDGELDLAIIPERVSLKRELRLSAWAGAGVDCSISKDELQTMARIAIYFRTWQRVR